MGLKAVDTTLPEPPYPPTTKAGAFAFEIEVDRLVASDTWLLLPAEVKPWALMAWVMSWQQVPCGSWPNNDDVIAARLGVDRRWFEVNKGDVMRGWKLHKDGRWYHNVVSQKVLGFMEVRDKWKSNKKNARQQKQQLNPDVQVDSSRSPNGVHPMSSPSSSSSSSSTKKTSKDACFAPSGVDESAWRDFDQHRNSSAKLKRGWSAIAKTKAANILRNLTPEQQRACVDHSIIGGYSGLFPDAVKRQRMPSTNDGFNKGPEV